MQNILETLGNMSVYRKVHIIFLPTSIHTVFTRHMWLLCMTYVYISFHMPFTYIQDQLPASCDIQMITNLCLVTDKILMSFYLDIDQIRKLGHFSNIHGNMGPQSQKHPFRIEWDVSSIDQNHSMGISDGWSTNGRNTVQHNVWYLLNPCRILTHFCFTTLSHPFHPYIAML